MRDDKGRGERSELVEKIRNFLDEDRRLSLNIVSIQFGISVANVHRMCKICSQGPQ